MNSSIFLLLAARFWLLAVVITQLLVGKPGTPLAAFFWWLASTATTSPCSASIRKPKSCSIPEKVWTSSSRFAFNFLAADPNSPTEGACEAFAGAWLSSARVWVSSARAWVSSARAWLSYAGA